MTLRIHCLYSHVILDFERLASRAVARLGLPFLLILAAQLPSFSASAATLHLLRTDEAVGVGAYFQAYEDREGSLRAEDVVAPNSAIEFKALGTSGVPNLGYTKSVWWLRLDIDAESAGPRYLEIAYPSLDSVELFVPRAEGRYERVASGDSLPYAQRPLPHHNLVFPIDVPAGSSRLFLRVASAGNLTIPATLWEPAAFHWHDQRDYAGFFLYYGMLLALGLYNLLLFFRLRERVYLYYVLFLCGMFVGIASQEGHAGQFLWPHWPRWTHFALTVGMGSAGLMAACFSRAFLDLRRNLPRMDKIFVLWIGWFAASIAVNLVSYRLSEELVSVGSIGFCLTAFSTGIASFRRRQAGARFFLLAWTLLLVGSTTLAARNFGWVPTNFMTSHGFQIGSALEMLLLSFALADRLQALKRLEYEATTDPLTSLHNRRSLFSLGETELRRVARHGRRLATAIIDVDHFKSINDTYGHAIGDEVLVALARRLKSELRDGDVIGRLGGEEFAVIMPETGLASACEVCERLRAAIDGEAIETPKGVLRIAVSIGVAEWRGGEETLEKVLGRADVALYEAKNKGRNRVCTATPPADAGTTLEAPATGCVS